MGLSGPGAQRSHHRGRPASQGGLTKMGNGFLARRALIEAAYGTLPAARAHHPHLHQKPRQEGLPKAVTDTAWKAQSRLHGRFKHLAGAGQEETPKWPPPRWPANPWPALSGPSGRMVNPAARKSMTGFIALELAPAGFAGPRRAGPACRWQGSSRRSGCVPAEPYLSAGAEFSLNAPAPASPIPNSHRPNPIATNTRTPFLNQRQGTDQATTSVVC